MLQPDITCVPTVSCSWGAAASQNYEWVHMVPLNSGDGLNTAEQLMSAAVDGEDNGGGVDRNCSAVHVVLEGSSTSSSPWIQLQMHGSPAAALCLCTNARVLQVHQGEDDDVPLLTHEGNAVTASSSVDDDDDSGVLFYNHFLHSGSSQPLLVNGVTYRVKFFARQPRNQISIRCMCVVLDDACMEGATTASAMHPAHGLVMSDDTSVDAQHRTTVVGGHDDSALEAIQLQLARMECLITTGFSTVSARLDAMECRIQRMEEHATSGKD